MIVVLSVPSASGVRGMVIVAVGDEKITSWSLVFGLPYYLIYQKIVLSLSVSCHVNVFESHSTSPLIVLVIAFKGRSLRSSMPNGISNSVPIFSIPNMAMPSP